MHKDESPTSENTREKEHVVVIEEPFEFLGSTSRETSSKYLRQKISEKTKNAHRTCDETILSENEDNDATNSQSADDKISMKRKRGMSEPIHNGKFRRRKEICISKDSFSSSQSGMETNFLNLDADFLSDTQSKQMTSRIIPQSKSAPLLGLIHQPLTSSLSFRIRQWIQPADTKINMKVFGGRKAMEDEQLRLRKVGFVIHPTSPFR